MNIVAIQVFGEPAFFDEVTSEAARLDRSPSWLLGRCLGSTLPKLASSVVVAAQGPDKPSSERRMRTFFVPRDHVESCNMLALRLGMTSDEVLAYAWQAGRDDVRAMPSS